MFSHVDDAPARIQTPVDHSVTLMPEASDIEEDNRQAIFSDLFRKSEAKVALLFSDDGSYNYGAIESLKHHRTLPTPLLPATTDHAPIQEPPLKKAKRAIDEDDYDDDDDEDDDDDDDGDSQESPLKSKGAAPGAPQQLLSPSKSGSSPVQYVPSPVK